MENGKVVGRDSGDEHGQGRKRDENVDRRSGDGSKHQTEKPKSKREKSERKQHTSDRGSKHRKKAVSKKKHRRKHHRRDEYSSTSSSRSSGSDDSDSSSDERRKRRRTDDTTKKTNRTATERQVYVVPNTAQIGSVAYTNNEERQERRMLARAALIENKFGYTADSNPFNDPNLVETFVWNKKKQQDNSKKRAEDKDDPSKKKTKTNVLLLIDEIDKVRERRQNREEQKMEMERMKAEESRMREYEHYDQFQQKEEQFHLQQQKLRSAIRLINHREKPIDVFAKHILLFGGLSSTTGTSPDDYTSVTKYQEHYNVMDVAMETLDIEIEEPYILLKSLKLQELEELLIDIDVFRKMEREATAAVSGVPPSSNHIILLQYWDNLYIVTIDEIKYLQQQSGNGANITTTTNSSHSNMVQKISNIFVDQSITDLIKMNNEILTQLQQQQNDETYDKQYWTFVHEQIMVYMAKFELSRLHSKMLTRQLERLEQRRKDLLLTNSANASQVLSLPPTDHTTFHALPNSDLQLEEGRNRDDANDPSSWTIPSNVPVDMLDDLEEELGLTSEIVDPNGTSTAATRYQGHDDEQYRSRKPRYYNRVKSGYDWSKYNQTHYDRDNPPPKIVQGYKFNIFYPDLINPMITPQYKLEPVVMDGVISNEYCIIRFHAGPPYEDIAFQIVNREWNRSRKRGYKCTFERGVLSLYFNFTTHWYRK